MQLCMADPLGWASQGLRAWPAAGFLIFLLALQIYARNAPQGGGGRIQMGAITLLACAVVGFAARLAERAWPQLDAAERLRAT